MHYLGTLIDSPIGALGLLANGEGVLSRVVFHREGDLPDLVERLESEGHTYENHPHLLAETVAQVRAYFGGSLTHFTLELAPEGTPFQRDVWAQLRNIPFGTCVSYADIAANLGKPGAMRAVGLANGRNPIPIIIPCHRVIGANGHMVGFTGGMDIKNQLLVHEGYLLC